MVIHIPNHVAQDLVVSVSRLFSIASSHVGRKVGAEEDVVAVDSCVDNTQRIL